MPLAMLGGGGGGGGIILGPLACIGIEYNTNINM